MRQSVRNAADSTQVKDARRVEKDAETVRAAEFRALTRDPAFTRFARDLLTDCCFFETALGANPEHTAFRGGKREIGLALINRYVTYAPDQLAALLIAPSEPE